MKKKIRRIVEYLKNHKSRIKGVIILSIIICMLFAEYISDFIYSRAQYADVVIRAYPLSVGGVEKSKIVDNNYARSNTSNIVATKKYGFYSFDQMLNAIVDIHDMEIVLKEDSELGFGYFYPVSENSYMKLKMPIFSNTCLTIAIDNNEFGLIISCEKNGFERYIGEYENGLEGLETINIYLFDRSDYIYVYIYYVITYFMCFVASFLIIMFFLQVIDLILITDNFFNQYSSKWMFVILFLLYFLYSSIIYANNKEVFQVGEKADAYYYMHPMVWDEDGRFSWRICADYLYSFRGYFPILTAIVFNSVAKILSVDVMFCYFVYFGIVIAFAIGIMIPRMYKSFSKRECTNLMVLLMYGVFFLFWRKCFFYALTDIPAAMITISAVAYMSIALKESRCNKWICTGLFIGLATSYRAAYTYVFVGICIIFAVDVIEKIKKREIGIKKSIGLFMGLVGGLLLVTWPQLILNLIRGHIGIFPFSGGWLYDINSGKVISDTWSDFTVGLHTYGFMTPQNSDRQLALIDQYYYMDKYYDVGDALYILLANPVQFGCGYLKRLFWAMSIGTESVYGALPSGQFLSLATMLINYWIFGTFIYMWYKNRDGQIVHKKVGILYALLALVTIVIQNLAHIERRYNLFFLLMVYFFVIFVGLCYYQKLRKNGEYVSIRYIVTMTIFVVSCFIIRQMIEVNFVKW